jgi:hypothetical protein
MPLTLAEYQPGSRAGAIGSAAVRARRTAAPCAAARLRRPRLLASPSRWRMPWSGWLLLAPRSRFVALAVRTIA